MSKFTMEYVESAGYAPYTVHMEVDEDANLRQMFSAFARMTDMIGYHSGSWDKIIQELYDYCILHTDAPEDYDVYQYAFDCIDQEAF